MTMPRRRIVRSPPSPSPPPDPQRQRRMQKLRNHLEKERVVLGRWMVKLRRAFHSVEKSQRKLAHLEKQLAKQED